MMESKKVQILMSTYNGEKYLKEQIDSLLDQNYKNIEILIRDDGSKDTTPQILKDYAGKYDNIRIFLEENTGVNRSFFRLLELSDADYIAFCDQDDVWLPEKIEMAVKKLEGIKGPAMYAGNRILVDDKLNVLQDQTGDRYRPGFGNALIENICTGCTVVINKKLAGSIQNNMPLNAVLHDWWIYLVASYIGKVIYDTNAYIMYRQHAGNVVGQSASRLGLIKAKIGYLKKSRGKLKAQLNEFRRIYHGDIDKDKLTDIVLQSETLRGKTHVFDKRIYRQKKSEQIVTRFLMLINRLL